MSVTPEPTETLPSGSETAPDAGQPARALSPAAERALAEAAARRAVAQEREEPRPREIDGRGGLEPVRYGDWEIKGLTADF